MREYGFEYYAPGDLTKRVGQKEQGGRDVDTIIELYGPNDTRAGIVFERRLWEGKLPFVPQVSDNVCISIDSDMDLNFRVIGIDIDVSPTTASLNRVVISVRRI